MIYVFKSFNVKDSVNLLNIMCVHQCFYYRVDALIKSQNQKNKETNWYIDREIY